MHSSGLQGGRARVFALHKPGNEGAHVLVFVSTLKLNLANHTVILDIAVLPLSHNLTGNLTVQNSLSGLQTAEKICSITVSDAGLKLWKTIMPAWTERCRTWKHKPASCEYLKRGEIPLPMGWKTSIHPSAHADEVIYPQNS